MRVDACPEYTTTIPPPPDPQQEVFIRCCAALAAAVCIAKPSTVNEVIVWAEDIEDYIRGGRYD
jgi:hypothetical protein